MQQYCSEYKCSSAVKTSAAEEEQKLGSADPAVPNKLDLV